MAKIRLACLVLLASIAAGSAYAQIRAVNFPSGAVLASGQITDNVPLHLTPQGVISFWFSALSIAPGTNQTILASYAPSGIAALLVAFDDIVGDPNIAAGTHMKVLITDGTAGGQGFQWLSDTMIPYDGHWHHIGITYDTSNFNPSTTKYALVTSLDGLGMVSNAFYTGAMNLIPAAFDSPFWSNTWSVGALKLSGGYGDFYQGDLAEVYTHVDTADYLSILNVARRQTGFAAWDPSFGTFGPMELGPKCAWVMEPGALLPVLCMRGGISTFANNQGGATVFTAPPGALSIRTSIADPWELLP